jgi:hypothetical protein
MYNCATGFPKVRIFSPEGPRPNGCTSAAHNFHIKATSSGQCRLPFGQLNVLCTTCLIKDSVRMEYHAVRTVAIAFPYLCLRRKSFYLSNTRRFPDGITKSF